MSSQTYFQKCIGEFIRARRSCTTEADYSYECTKITTRLRQQGYSNSTITWAKYIAQSKTRREYLFGESKHLRAKKPDGSGILTFSTPYSVDYNCITSILKKYLPILYQDPLFDSILQNGVRFVARRGRNLGNILAHSALPSVTQRTWLHTVGFLKYGKPRCGLCKVAT